jgi:hypothetical protein
LEVTAPLSLWDLRDFIETAFKAGAKSESRVDAGFNTISVAWIIEAPLGQKAEGPPAP